MKQNFEQAIKICRLLRSTVKVLHQTLQDNGYDYSLSEKLMKYISKYGEGVDLAEVDEFQCDQPLDELLESMDQAWSNLQTETENRNTWSNW